MCLFKRLAPRALFALLFCILCACDRSHGSFARNVHAEIDPGDVLAFEASLYEFAHENNLGVLPKSREGMSFITDGYSAFTLFICLPGKVDPFMYVSNAGVATKMRFTLIGPEKDVSEREALIYEKLLFLALKSDFVSDFSEFDDT